MNALRRKLGSVRDACPLTLAGFVLASMGFGLFYFYGRQQADYVLYTAGIGLMALVGISLTAVLIGTLALLLSLSMRSGHVVEGRVDADQPLETGFHFLRFRFWPLFDVSMTWDAPDFIDVTSVPKGGLYSEVITPRQRGRVTSVVRRFRVRDVFGLAAFGFPKRWDAALRVAPSRARVDLSIALRETTGEGFSHPSGEPQGDLVEMRRYGPGDPLRLVLWKTYARTRRLMVRMPERAIVPQRSTVACLVAGQEDEPSASTARAFVEAGLLGEEYRFFADGATSLARQASDAVELMVQSARFRHQGGEALARLPDMVDRAQLGNCVVFVPAEMGSWFGSLASFAQRAPLPPTIIVGVDHTVSPRPPLWTRLLRAQAAHRAPARSLPALYDALCRLGGPVRVVHRPTGQVVDTTAIEALRRL